MANVKISDLPAATGLNSTDIIPVVQSGVTKRSTAGAITDTMTGILQVGTGAVARSTQTEIRELHISVKQYGAVGDGLTDDTAAILAAYTACPTGGTLFFPVATSGYLVSSKTTIAKKIRMIFEGGTGDPTFNPSSYLLKKSTMLTSAVDITAYGVIWDGGGVVGQGGNAGDGISIQARNVTLNNVTATSCGQDGISVGVAANNTNADFPTLNHCIANSNGRDGIHIESNYTGLPEANCGILSQCVTSSNTRDGIRIAAASYTQVLNCNGTSNTGWGLNLDKSIFAVISSGDYEGNTAGQIQNGANATKTRWVSVDPVFLVADNATSSNKQIVLHRTGLDKNLVAGDGNAATAVRMLAMNDAQNATVPFELQGSIFELIGGALTTYNKIYMGSLSGGTKQALSGWYSCSGVPNNAFGSNGDYCSRDDGGAGAHIYFRTGGAWVAIA